MEDMIKRIIELDRMAKENLTRANQLKVDSEQKIATLSVEVFGRDTEVELPFTDFAKAK